MDPYVVTKHRLMLSISVIVNNAWNANDTATRFADAMNTHRRLLDAFCFWLKKADLVQLAELNRQFTDEDVNDPVIQPFV